VTRKEVIEFALQWQRREHERATHDIARAERFDAENAPYRRRLELEEAATALIVGLLETVDERTALLLKRAEEYRAARVAKMECEAALASAWSKMMHGLTAPENLTAVKTIGLQLDDARSALADAEVALHEAVLPDLLPREGQQ